MLHEERPELSLNDDGYQSGTAIRPAKSEIGMEQDWQRAQQRVLLYVQLMRLPVKQGLEIALEALKRTESEFLQTREEPISLSMRSVREVLSEEQDSSGINRPNNGDHFRADKLGLRQVEIRCAPPLNRGFMAAKISHKQKS
jgi:hypothetical protein